MDLAADFTTGLWVEVLATVGVGTVGVKFTGAFGIGVVGMGWQLPSPCTFFVQVLWFSFSSETFLVLGISWVMVCYFGEDCWCLVVTGFGVGSWVWDQACPPMLGMSSSFR